MYLFISQQLKPIWQLTKPRVIALIVFCAWVGMLLAQPWTELNFILVFWASLGIYMVSGAAAAMNCLIEQKIDAVMARTKKRPLPEGNINSKNTLYFSLIWGSLGLAILHFYVNDLTLWLTFATFVGYAFIYTILLKPATPQNIVIGGASGAMPPVLGWAAMIGEVPPEAWTLFLIIFIWTPPHFWALALYRIEDYKKSGLPMLPITHGSDFTRLQMVLYTILLIISTILPYSIHLAGVSYLLMVLLLNAWFLYYIMKLYRQYSDQLSKKTFFVSIWYLFGIFAALIIDKALLLLF